jgi:hypothetical protein
MSSPYDYTGCVVLELGIMHIEPPLKSGVFFKTPTEEGLLHEKGPSALSVKQLGGIVFCLF